MRSGIGTTDGGESRNGTLMANVILRHEFCGCQLYRYELSYELYMRLGLGGSVISACRGSGAKLSWKLLSTFAMITGMITCMSGVLFRILSVSLNEIPKLALINKRNAY